MNDLAKRIAALSPEQRALFELRLKQKGLNARQAQSILKKRKASDAIFGSGKVVGSPPVAT